MSLFHLQPWYTTETQDAYAMTVASLTGHRGMLHMSMFTYIPDQILIGSLNGSIRIIDLSHDIENRNETAVLLERTLPYPILQMKVARFLNSYDDDLIAVLHPKHLSFYRLNTADNVSYTLDHIFEHKLKSGPAFNFCLGEFTASQCYQVYVQSINCALGIYESENHLLDRPMHNAIHPGPICYARTSKTLYNASGGYLEAYPHNSFTATVSANQKKMLSDWSFNLGDTAIDIADISAAPIQPSIIVLCKRIVYCFTHGGSPRFMIRLQCVATSLLVYRSNNMSQIQLCVGTSTKTLLFYQDTTMVWSAQLQNTPTVLALSTFSDTLRSLITCLSDDFKLTVGYLGTEPSLFRMPVTETRYIDFETRKREIDEFESIIRKYRRNASLGEKSLELEVSVKLDEMSMAYEGFEGAPSCSVVVTAETSAPTIDLVFNCDAYSSVNHVSLTASECKSYVITCYPKTKPVMDARYTLVATTNNGETSMIEGHLPLKLLCAEVGALRNAQVKLSIDSSAPGLEIKELYPEFATDSQSSLGLQPYGTDVVVTLFSAAKNGRYRVQSDSAEFLYLVFDDLVRRIRRKQPDAKLSCPVPLHLFVSAISKHAELEERRNVDAKEVDRISIQMRHVETMLLNKLKAERDENMTPINVLVNYTYRELLTALDRQRIIEADIQNHLNDSFKSMLNLMRLCMEFSGIQLPFDGQILNGNDATLAEIIAPLLGHKSSETALDSKALIQLLVGFCEQGGRLANITELPEDEESHEDVQGTHDMVQLDSGAMSSTLDANS